MKSNSMGRKQAFAFLAGTDNRFTVHVSENRWCCIVVSIDDVMYHGNLANSTYPNFEWYKI